MSFLSTVICILYAFHSQSFCCHLVSHIAVDTTYSYNSPLWLLSVAYLGNQCIVIADKKPSIV